MTRERCESDEHPRRMPAGAPVAEESLVHAAAMLSAAGDPGRIRLLLALQRGPAFVSDLARELGLRLSHVSQQLAVLREANLVRRKRRGKSVEYALVDEHIHTLVERAIALVTRPRK